VGTAAHWDQVSEPLTWTLLLCDAAVLTSTTGQLLLHVMSSRNVPPGILMAKNDQEEQFEKLMSANLVRVVDFLKFAETKNAALLTFCSAWLLGIGNLLSSGKRIPFFVDSGFRLSFIFFALGALFAIVSFLPKLSIGGFTKSPSAHSNMLFFGDIAAMPTEKFAHDSIVRYRPEEDRSCSDEYIADLSMQIAVNSRIVLRKMRLFAWGARCVMLALFMLVAPAIGQIL
jgi:Family of unknown function (DUF5706)